ncbi:hypothetical protein [Bradyrhizobium sp.]|uniref:hypothetical protein n=1 Tax=Bradyrhizobium sp. TaxID=376 RepID=UPI002D1FC02F|nr:hypothetical protein [Bradyrhizobium sp.]
MINQLDGHVDWGPQQAHRRERGLVLLQIKLLHCDLGDLRRIANTLGADLYDLPCDDLGERIVSVNEVQRAQSPLKCQVQIFDFIEP